MRHIQARKGFFLGDRYRTPQDGPFPADDNRAAALVKQGLADFVQPINVAGEDVMSALGVEAAASPAPARARKAALRA